MAELVAGFLGPAIEVVKWIGAPIIRQFNYLCCFTTNITDLKHEAEELENAAGDLQDRVDRARDNVEIIAREVETWLTKSNDIKDLKNTILDEVPNVESGCLKLGARFSLSKKAKKTTDRMKKLLGEKKIDAISQRGPPASMRVAPLGSTYEFESRRQIEEDIMTTLRGENVNLIAIYGMGGLGKTTMANIIKKRALEQHVFEEVVMAVVSQPVDKLKIQVEIGGSLNLKFEGETSEVRVQKLHARLTTGKKKILLVLDDVWERLELEDLGIPRGCKGCTILITSRNHDVLRAMNVEKVFGMEVLSEEDAWLLFRGRAGTCVDDIRLNSIAKEVVKECRGLPIALTTVGAALKDENNASIWKDALRQLAQSDPDIPEVITEVYNPLKLSYDALGSKHAKSVFLLCCLFGEDSDIPVENLTYFCMGLGIFEGSMEEASNRMCTLTKMLKSRSLLLDGFIEDHVRMHDVVRDVCIFIAKQEEYIDGNDCTWISSSLQQVGERTKLPTNLRLLFLSGDSDIEEEFKLQDSSFLEGIRNLHVLFIEKYYTSLTSLPHATPPLRNLNTLVLESCQKLETISVVGELVNLEILICRGCYLIKELPPGIKRLNRLKLLDLSWSKNLERIGRGIISSLVGLEELKMLRSFKKWEATWDIEERENGNAGVRELESLINLRCLEIQIEDPALAAQNMRLSSNLDRFHITIGPSYYSSDFSDFSSNKKLSLEWDGETRLGDWVEMQLLRDTECLYLTGNGANNVELAKSENIRWLELDGCETMKNIGRTSLMYNDGRYGVFPHMECLKLSSLPQLEEIWDGQISSNSFQNLKTLQLEELRALKQFWKSSSPILFHNLSSIEIRGCPCLRSLEQLSIAGKDCLSQLEILVIKNCEMVEQVFLWNEEKDQNISNSESTITKMFPKLEEVTLYNLPNLVTLCEGIEGIEFPLLTTMKIENCPKMTSMVSSNEKNRGGSNNADIDDHHYSHLFCPPQKVSFGNLKQLETDRNAFCGHKIDVSLFIRLKRLDIIGYEDSMSLFWPSIAENLVNLKKLSISYCEEMVKVIEDEEEKAVSGDGQRTPLLFPKLQEIKLYWLPKLVSFCEWKCDVELPSLRKVEISYCPNMKYFTLGLLTTPKLEIVKIDCKPFEINDLNDTLQQHYLAQAKEELIEQEEEEESDEDEHETKGDQIEEEHNS